MNALIVALLALAFATCARGYVNYENCESLLNRDLLSRVNIPQASFAFSSCCKSCATDSEFRAPNKMNCTGTFTRFAYVLPTSTMANAGNPLVSETRADVQGTPSQPCLSRPDECGKQACREISPVTIDILQTRQFAIYQLTQTNAILPFGFLPINGAGWGAGTGCLNATTSATCSGEIVPQNVNCNLDLLMSRFPGDFVDLYSSMNASCSNSSDPITTNIREDLCGSVCCTSCVNRTQPTYHRRWAMGPACYLQKISSPSWKVGFLARVSGGVVSEPWKVVSLNADAGSVAMGTQNKLRMYVREQFNLPSTSFNDISGDYMLICDYSNNGGVVNQGVLNPYVERPPWFSRMINDPNSVSVDEYLDSYPFGAPPIITNETAYYGGGVVPTQRSLGQNFSAFYIPQSIVAQLFETNSVLASDQTTQSETMIRALQACSVGNSDYFDLNVDVPGWWRNTPSGPVIQKSICQLSAELNDYALRYGELIANGSIAPADAYEILRPIQPRTLLPMYRIDRPNVWFQNGKMIIDAGLSLPTRAGLAVYLDSSDERVTFGNIFLPYTINVDQTSCTVRFDSPTALGKGEVIVVVNRQTETGGAAGVRLRTVCFLANGTALPTSPNETQIMPATDAGVLSKAPRWSFTGTYDSINAATAPYCNITLIGLGGVQDQKTLDQLNGMQCRFVLRGGELYADLRQQIGDAILVAFEEEEERRESDTFDWWAYLIMALVASFVILIGVGAIVAAIVFAQRKKSKQKKN